MNVLTSDNTLTAWLAVYITEEIPGTAESNLKHWRQSLQWFNGYLKREATIDDLTEPALLGMMQSLAERGFTPATIDVVVKKLMALWRYLARAKVVERCAPYPAPHADDTGALPRKRIRIVRKPKVDPPKPVRPPVVAMQIPLG